MGAKQSGSQTVTQQPDALTQEWRKMVMGMGLGAIGAPGIPGADGQRLFGMMAGKGAGAVSPMGPQLQPVPGMDPASQAAMQNYQGYANAGNLGLGALSGDANALGSFINPYNQHVIDQVTGQYGRLADMTRTNISDAATKAGAFGGSRQGVAEGVALGELGRGMGQQVAGLQYQGFNDAMGRAGSLANMGLGANSQLASLGDYSRQIQMSQDPAMRNLQIMQGLLSGMPFGMSTSQPTYSNPLGSLLGIGSMLGGLGWNPFGK